MLSWIEVVIKASLLELILEPPQGWMKSEVFSRSRMGLHSTTAAPKYQW
jgi:hypothetical protein